MHTTGIDIKQALDARAAITVSKDTTLRDYAQGAWRMRGIAAGQTLHLVLIEEVHHLIREGVGEGQSIQTDTVAWLLLNEMRTATMQASKLSEQSLLTVYRKQALKALLDRRCGRDTAKPGLQLDPPFSATILAEAPSDATDQFDGASANWNHLSVVNGGGGWVEYHIANEAACTAVVKGQYTACDSRPLRLFINGELKSDDFCNGVTGSWTDHSCLEGATLHLSFCQLEGARCVLRLMAASHISR